MDGPLDASQLGLIPSRKNVFVAWRRFPSTVLLFWIVHDAFGVFIHRQLNPAQHARRLHLDLLLLIVLDNLNLISEADRWLVRGNAHAAFRGAERFLENCRSSDFVRQVLSATILVGRNLVDVVIFEIFLREFMNNVRVFVQEAVATWCDAAKAPPVSTRGGVAAAAAVAEPAIR